MGPEEKGIWQRIRRFLEPQSAGETAALMGTSMVPGVGTAIDMADLAAGIEDRDPMRIGIAALAAGLPIISAQSLKGLLSLGEHGPRWMKSFQEDALRRSVAAGGPKSRQVTTLLDPDDFIRLARPGYREASGQLTRDLVERNVPFSDIPFLYVEHDNQGIARIVGHEGRHRARALRGAGIAKMPVRLKSVAGYNPNSFGPEIRWLSQDDIYDRIDTWPRRLLSEEGEDIMEFPIDRYPTHVDARIVYEHPDAPGTKALVSMNTRTELGEDPFRVTMLHDSPEGSWPSGHQWYKSLDDAIRHVQEMGMVRKD